MNELINELSKIGLACIIVISFFIGGLLLGVIIYFIVSKFFNFLLCLVGERRDD